MRIIVRSFVMLGTLAVMLATSIFDFVVVLPDKLHLYFREAFDFPEGFIPRLITHVQPPRRISMAATALNDRLLGGVRVQGYLGRPAVKALAG